MILNSYNNILVLAPHTDDGELGLGGTISKLIELGKKVTYVAFSTAQQSVPEGFPKDILKTEVKKATAQLGISPENLIIYNYEVRKLGYVRQEILEELIRLKKANSFDLVFIPSLHDIHQDHTTIAQEGLRAFKNTTLLGYELICQVQFTAEAAGILHAMFRRTKPGAHPGQSRSIEGIRITRSTRLSIRSVYLFVSKNTRRTSRLSLCRSIRGGPSVPVKL